ncbi:MAG: SDR family NAD(P)-dependent oxidoreductase, partial [Kiritimatiellae bacterium]|nr:SDR family NAD(P)-dependent oxidoreductase [Kiritimatiellia bacterium]
MAIVTGAARGIGQAVAVRLASAGADIALCDVQAGWLDETAGRIAELGRRAEKYAVDVSSSADVEAAISQIHQDFGH